MSILAGFMVPHPPMIVPDIGKGSETQVQKTIDAYERVAGEITELRPDTIVITSPHSIMYADYFHISPGRGALGSFADFMAPQVNFSEDYDEELVGEICRLAKAEKFPAGTMGEKEPRLDHGTMVPLWFIRNRYKEGKIVRIGLSGLPLADHYRLGQLIKQAAENTGRRTVPGTRCAGWDRRPRRSTSGPTSGRGNGRNARRRSWPGSGASSRTPGCSAC